MSRFEVDIVHTRPLNDAEDEPNYELELCNSRHVTRVWETVSGWVWSCKLCEAFGRELDERDAMVDALRHMRTEVPWWRKALDRIAP